jgi:erythromycin esterase-like protein
MDMDMSQIVESIKSESIQYKTNDDLQKIIDAIGDRKYVLLGEASHGTSEFYSIRAELTKKLIEQKGFSIIAVEGDWPSCFEVNRYVKGYENTYQTSKEVLESFNRWPNWMWANEEIAELVDWLKDYNQSNVNKIGFYGIDVYSLWESMEEIISYLQKTGSGDVEIAKKAFSCFEPHSRKPENYGVSASFLSEDCIDEVTKLLVKVQQNRHQYASIDEADLSLEVNALVAANAERYYRAMVQNDVESWNIRDFHMSDAIDKLTSYYGEDAKVIVWEHNTHIGDARATDMKAEGTVNVGQIVRERYGVDNVYAVGFGTHRGTVIAARNWGDNPKITTVPEGERGSWEDLLHRASPVNKILLFNSDNKRLFNSIIGHRAIGVVYHPEYEHLGNYVPSQVASRYDGFIFVDQSHALKPLILKEVLV